MAKMARMLKIRLRRPVHIVLALVESSEPGKQHRICLDRHNMVYCTCRGWRYNGHTCPHLTNFRNTLASAQERLSC